MFRSGFVFGVQLFVILIVCGSGKSAISKRLHKCLEYSTQTYGEAVPNCKNSRGISGVIERKQFPYIAIFGYQFLETEMIVWQCQGSLVSSRYVLKTGDCLNDETLTLTKVNLGASIKAKWGRSSSADYDIDVIIMHSLYNDKAYYYDVGLVKLSRKVEISENVRPICLPDSDLQVNTLFQVCYESSIDGKLLEIYKTNVVPNATCNELFFKPTKGLFQDGPTDNLLCTGQSLNTFNYYPHAYQFRTPLYIEHALIPCSHILSAMGSFSGARGIEVFVASTKIFCISDWIESVIWADGEDL